MSVKLGVGSTIHATAEISPDADIVIGDHCTIGPGVKILPGKFRLGDYSKIHDRVLINPKNFVTLGHLTWIGQGTVLDGTGGLQAGNYLGVGINSALYSHIRHGDVLEGCRFEENRTLVIGDDVWFVGMCLVSPVHVESKSMALLGSTVVKDMKANRVYGGNPARDLTEKMVCAVKIISTDEKIKKMQTLIEEYAQIAAPSFDKDLFQVVDGLPSQLDDRTYYDVTNRVFTKRNHAQEVKFNQWLFPYRAKFIPALNN